jgi:hypothetical protein
MVMIDPLMTLREPDSQESGSRPDEMKWPSPTCIRLCLPAIGASVIVEGRDGELTLRSGVMRVTYTPYLSPVSFFLAVPECRDRLLLKLRAASKQ